ncbi:hypothetical protein PCANB_001760 [Pneumocystis canis]|nr:hypothetical protein PCANB_001760 [Pneumocystis canis]
MSEDSNQIETQIKILNKLDNCFSTLQKALKIKLNENLISSRKMLALKSHLSQEITKFKDELTKLQKKECISDDSISSAKYYELYQEIINEKKKIKHDITELLAVKENDFERFKIEKEYFEKEIKNKELNALDEFKYKLGKIMESIE